MEVFAAMMNPGDVLEIYPMSPVEVEGKSYTQGVKTTTRILRTSQSDCTQEILVAGAGVS